MTHSHEAQKLRQLVEKIERLEAQKREMSEEISIIYKDMANDGFDTSAIKALIRLRSKDQKKLEKQEAMMDYYMSLLGEMNPIVENNL